MPRLQTRLSTAIVLLALAACGGGGTSPSPTPPPAPPPPPPPAPAPVATVTVTPNTANLVPQQTQALSAATLDAAGNTLSGRTVTWSTSAAAIATVSQAGLVTAAGGGTATITATSEGKTGNATISVADGGFVGTGGSTVDAAGGAVKIVIPPGAVSGPLAITVTPNASPPALPALPALSTTAFLVGGTTYNLGPEGTTFSAPITVTIKYDPAKLPAWVGPGDLMLLHHNGTQWEKLPNLVVDPVAHTLTATATSFSPYGAVAVLPPVTLTPANGQVNLHQISAQFTATIPGHPSTSGLQYVWTTTGANGGVGNLFQNQGQYTWTNFIAPPGVLDVVTVQVNGNIDPLNPSVLVPLTSGQASVDASLQFTYEVNPDDSQIPFGGTRTLDASIRNSTGGIYTPPGGLATLHTWTSSSLAGKLDINSPNHQTDVTHGTYTARTAALSPPKAPRIDEITVDFYIGYVKDLFHIVPGYTIPFLNMGIQDQYVHDGFKNMWDKKSGTANAFIEVAPKTDVASFTVRTTPSGGGSCVAAVANILKEPGATSYTLDVTGIDPSSAFGAAGYHRVVTGTTSNGSFMDIFDGGTFYGVPMDGGCASLPSSITFRQGLYQQQYGHATFTVKIAP